MKEKQIETEGGPTVALARRDSVISIVLIDDHDIVREGLRAILDREPDMRVVGEAADPDQALTVLSALDPEVIVLDFRLPGMEGAALCREIAERRLRGRVIILSAFLEEEIVYAALMAGACAYVVKDVEPSDLKRAIRLAAQGRMLVDPKVAGRIANWMMRLDAPRRRLTPTQTDILHLMCAGLSNREIAQSTGLSLSSIKKAVTAVFARLEVSSRPEAVAAALRRGLVRRGRPRP